MEWNPVRRPMKTAGLSAMFRAAGRRHRQHGPAGEKVMLHRRRHEVPARERAGP